MGILRLIQIGAAVLVLGFGFLWFSGVITFKGSKASVDDSGTKVDVKVQLDPYAKAQALYTTFQYGEALKAFSDALAKDPKSPNAPHARFAIGVCYEGVGDKKRALQAYEAFIAAYPDHEDYPKAKKNAEMIKEGGR